MQKNTNHSRHTSLIWLNVCPTLQTFSKRLTSIGWTSFLASREIIDSEIVAQQTNKPEVFVKRHTDWLYTYILYIN